MSKSISIIVSTVDSELEFSVSPSTTGKQLFDQVARTLNIREIWWFGLRFVDTKGLKTWLKLNRKVTSQDVGKVFPLRFQFRVKYYPEDVAEELIQETTQKLFYLQVREDILNGDLYTPAETCVLLASYACQCKYLDFTENLIQDKENFIYKDRLLPQKIIDQHEMTMDQWIDKIVMMYKSHKDMLREDSMMEYLKIAQDLEMYGVNYFEITNKKGTELYLGIDALGLSICNKTDKLNPKIGFPWSEIRNVSYTNKKFSIKSTDKSSSNFVFMVKHSRINKTILNLSMGNHDLYLRRRKAETIEMQQMRVQAQEDKRIKLDSKDKVNQERMAKEMVERKLAELELILKASNEKNEESQRQMEEYERKIKELEDLLEDSNKQKHDLEDMHTRLAENNKALEEAQKMVSEDYERLVLENSLIQSEIQLKNNEVEQSAAELKTRQEELEKLRREREELELRARQLEDLAIEKENNREDAHNFELLESADDRREENRTTTLSGNKDLMFQLKQLASDLEQKRVESKMDEIDLIHRENQRQSRDKFQTLRQIRQGNTKKRVDEFESL